MWFTDHGRGLLMRRPVHVSNGNGSYPTRPLEELCARTIKRVYIVRSSSVMSDSVQDNKVELFHLTVAECAEG